MNTQHRFTDRSPKQQRAQILAPASVLLGTTELVCYGGLKYCAMVAFGWIELDRDGDHVLMQAPESWA